MVTFLNSLLYVGAALLLLTIYAYLTLPSYIGRFFSAATACMAIWSFAYYVELTSYLDVRVAMIRFKYGFTLALVYFLLRLTSLVTALPSWLKGRYWWWVLGPVIAGALLGWTSPWHNAFRYNFGLSDETGFTLLTFERGILDMPLVIWFNFLALFNIGLLTYASFTSRGTVRRSSILMLTALGVPGIHNALVFIGLEVVPGINLTPWLFIVTSPALFMAVVDLQSLDTISRARHQLMEQNRSAFLLVDVKGRVLDFNNRFLQLAGIEAVAQMPLASLSLPEPFAVRLLKPKERNELRVPLHCAEWPDLRYFDIQTIPVRDEKGELGAYLHVWEDVTSRVKDFEERQLIRQEERLLRDLHDGVGGLLAKIAMLTEELSGSDVTVNYVRQLAREGTAEVRALMNSAERRQLTWPDIVAEIRRYGQLLFDEQVDFEFRMTGNPPDAFLPLASSMSLYRVCREAMHNVARHARARNVLFTLGFMPDRLTIAICDDGLGMSADAQPGRGLGNMRKRIEELGGEFNMEADQGFTINLWIPLPLQDLMAVEVA